MSEVNRDKPREKYSLPDDHKLGPGNVDVECWITKQPAYLTAIEPVKAAAIRGRLGSQNSSQLTSPTTLQAEPIEQ